MATAAPIPAAPETSAPPPSFVTVEEYLHTAYEPDVDYVDGELEDRNVGEIDHSSLQRRLLLLLCALGDEWESRTLPETRTQVSATRFCVPDIAVMREDWDEFRIIRRPPLLCIEILSPEDRMQRVLRKASEYLAFGVQEVWIINPRRRTIQQIADDSSCEVSQGTIHLAGTPIQIPLDRLFSALDRQT